MALNTAGINAVLEDGNEAVIYVAIGSGPTAGDQTSAARVQLASSVAAGVITATGVPYAFTGTPGAGATHALLFSAPTGGTFYGFDALTGDQAFNAAGAYNLTALTVTGSSS
jgi:glucose dehydrogenase